MNNLITVLKKCLAELDKPEPRIDYIKGMVETMVEMQEVVKLPQGLETKGNAVETFSVTGEHTGWKNRESPKDETAILEAQATANLDRLKAMGLTNTKMT